MGLVAFSVLRWIESEEVRVESASRPPTDERVRVEVLNGGGRAGMARAATDELRDAGFDVVDMGNAASFDRDTSVVLDRIGRMDLARGVADALGIHSVEAQPDSGLYVEATVILGADWKPRDERISSGLEGSAVPWWDLRRFWR
jgi:hypothetical protein